MRAPTYCEKKVELINLAQIESLHLRRNAAISDRSERLFDGCGRQGCSDELCDHHSDRYSYLQGDPSAVSKVAKML